MVMKVGGGSLSRLSGDGDLVLFAADLSFFCVCILFHVVFFSTWNFISYLCCEKLFLSFEALFQLLPGLRSFSCSPFPVPFTTPSFLLPSTLFLFYTSLTPSSCWIWVWLFYPTTTSLGRWFVSNSFQVFLSQHCKFSRLFLEVGCMVDSVIEVFLRLYFE